MSNSCRALIDSCMAKFARFLYPSSAPLSLKELAFSKYVLFNSREKIKINKDFCSKVLLWVYFRLVSLMTGNGTAQTTTSIMYRSCCKHRHFDKVHQILVLSRVAQETRSEAESNRWASCNAWWYGIFFCGIPLTVPNAKGSTDATESKINRGF